MRLAILLGALAGLGLWLLLRELLPARPDLDDALRRLSASPDPVAAPNLPPGIQSSLGQLIERRFGNAPWLRIPHRDLRILRIEPATLLGEKAGWAIIGLIFPNILTMIWRISGGSSAIPLTMPVLVGVGLAIGGWLAPDYTVKQNATAARLEYARAVTAFTDFCALERAAGAGPVQALERAAHVGDSWVFRQIQERLQLAQYSGQAPWQALSQLADELGVSELSDLADIMALSGEEGASVYHNLRARARGLRGALLNKEHIAANEASERLVIPMASLGIVFVCLLATPSLAQLL